MQKYVLLKNRDTTHPAKQRDSEGIVQNPLCRGLVVGDGVSDADCSEPGCSGLHVAYRNPVWQLRLTAVPDSEDADNYTFGVGDMAMVVPKTDCFDTEALAQAEASTRNA